MPVSDEYLVFVTDQLGRLEGISIRRMFGGAGIYCGGNFFAIVADDVLYFKVDDSNRCDYEAAGMEPFTFTVDNKQAVMSFYEVPVDILENKEKVKLWALKSISVAQSAKKRPGRKKKIKRSQAPPWGQAEAGRRKGKR